MDTEPSVQYMTEEELKFETRHSGASAQHAVQQDGDGKSPKGD